MKLLSRFLDLIYPRKCPFCHHILKDDEDLICTKCGAGLPYTDTHASRDGDFFVKSVAPLYYENDVRESIHRFKFYGAASHASGYGKLLAECIHDELYGKFDIITWIPVSRKRLKERGYDQARLLAEETAGRLGSELTQTLTRVRHSPPQSGTGTQEKRRANISGAYICEAPELIKDKRVLVIDDVITSGATMSEAARTLLMNGADCVYGATLARSRD